MKIKKNDFIEIEYTGKVKDGIIFDTNIKEDAKKIELKIDPKPLVICIGQGMILPAIDDFLIEKELGNYTLELTADKAFGLRRRDLIKTMSLSAFKTSDQYPSPGMVFSFDNMLGKVVSVSGGRVIVDFNNPVAGKDVVYELRAKRILDNVEEKAKAATSILFGKEVPFKLENNKIIIETEKNFASFFLMFKEKIKEMLNLDLEIKEKPEKKQEIKKQEEKKEVKDNI